MAANRSPRSGSDRARKLEELRREEARRARLRTGLIMGAAVAVLALVIAGAWRIVGDETGAGESYAPEVALDGVKEYDAVSDHVTTPVDYDQTPPAGGAHNPMWLNCGIYGAPIPSENAVHSMEHGAVWVTYDPSLPAADVEKLRLLMPSTYIVLSPFEGLPSKVVVSAWGRQLAVDSVADPRVKAFITEFRLGGEAPEAGASCEGGSDGTLPLDTAAQQ